MATKKQACDPNERLVGLVEPVEEEQGGGQT